METYPEFLVRIDSFEQKELHYWNSYFRFMNTLKHADRRMEITPFLHAPVITNKEKHSIFAVFLPDNPIAMYCWWPDLNVSPLAE